MSASLVGSEMCIRDRPLKWASAVFPTPERSPFRSPPAIANWRNGSGLMGRSCLLYTSDAADDM
eukprot:11948451-Alexandrium_andersonii.AAC.1